MDEEMTEEMINKLLEEGEKVDNAFDEEALLLCIKNINEKFAINKALREKYKSNPEKFVDSEVDLHEEIKVMQRLAAYPNLINVFINNEGVESMVKLLTHQNLDIVNDAVFAIDEITDSDYLNETENPKDLLEYFISSNLFEILVDDLHRVQEADDQQLITDILSVFENFLEVYPFSSYLIAQRTKILPWALKQIKITEFSQNKLFASEILYTLAQSSTENQIALCKLEAVVLFIKILFEMRNKTYKLPENEEEFVHNISNSLCSCLMINENKKVFRHADGPKTMLLFMRENNLFRHLAVKILDFATQNNPKCCKDLVELDGLKNIFSYFMGKGFKNSHKNASLIADCEEHCLSIIFSLCKYTESVNKDRLLYKFKENNGEKCERLVEFYVKFNRKSKQISDSESDAEGDDIPGEDIYVKKLNKGLFSLQLVSAIIGFLLTSEHNDIKNKLLALFPINKIETVYIKNTLIEMSSHLGEEDAIEANNWITSKSFLEKIINLIKI